jgi:hypothetical protein
VRVFKDDLLEFGDLRNAIVHDRGKASVLLADPREEAVVEIEKILKRISHPKLLRSLPRPVPLRIFNASAALSDALSYMRENEFSQVITFHDGKHLLLSTVGLLIGWKRSRKKISSRFRRRGSTMSSVLSPRAAVSIVRPTTPPTMHANSSLMTSVERYSANSLPSTAARQKRRLTL